MAGAAWPTMSDYQEAVQNPASCFSDPRLRGAKAAPGAFGLPRAVTGAFASVYEMSLGRSHWAVRCFLHRIPDIRERYEVISKFLKSRPQASMVGFEYLPEGIRVRGEWYPILKMDWAAGDTLNVYVQKNLGRPKAIHKAADRLADLAAALEKQGAAHGDLQHGNILATDGALTLIDYDGMYVPALRGRASHETGHPDYQHPQRAATDFHERLDRFSSLVIALSLRAVAKAPELWKKFHHGENLLLRRSDFQKPDAAPVFGALRSVKDPDVERLSQALRDACAGPLASVPTLKEALARKGTAAARAASPRPASRPAAPVPAASPAPAPLPPPPARARPPAPAPVPSPVPPPAPAPAPAPAPPAAPARAQAGPAWIVRWVRPGPSSERHVYKVPVYETRDVRSTFVGIPIGTRKEKYVSRYQDHVEMLERAAAGHRYSVTALAFSADGRSLASAALDRTVRLWAVPDGRELAAPMAVLSVARSLAFVPGRTALAAALEDGGLVLWDFGESREVVHLATPDRSALATVAVAADGRLLAAGGASRAVFLWRLGTFEPAGMLRDMTGRVETLAFAADGGILCGTRKSRLEAFASGSAGPADGGKRLWSVPTRQRGVSAVAAPRGAPVVALAPDGGLTAWDPGTGSEVRRLPPKFGRVRSTALSPDGLRAAVGLADRTSRVLDAGTGDERAKLDGHPGPVTAVALSPAGREVATGARDGSVRLWSTR
ncbi:MAG: WD40 repeat domain-containing protein [Planctomycetales bacterium]|nr:WD40 repeat domain-containing protein [Planctomycetales bacterium]